MTSKKSDLPEDMKADWVQALALPDVPPAKINGSINPEHYRVRLGNITRIAEAAIQRGLSIPFNAESITKMIEREASMAGLDAASIADSRSEGDKILAAVDRLCDNGREAIWEITDDEIDILIKNFEDLIESPVNGAKPLIDRRALKSIDYDPKQDRNKREGKRWLNRLQRVKRLREMTRHPIPPSMADKITAEPSLQAAWEATHVLRFMLYVGRSSTITHNTANGFSTGIYRIGRHHTRFALDTWEARTGMLYQKGQCKIRGRRANKGVILVAPPGHGKPLSVDTPITTQDGYKRLGDISVGDMVKTHTGMYRQVTEVHEQGVLPTIKIKMESGREVVSALDHPFLTSGGWKYAKEITKYELIRTVVGDEIHLYDRVESIEQHEPTKCRCLTVDVDHTFLANDLVVHNSEFASHYLALEVCLRPTTQALYIHAIADKAQEQKAHVSRLFSKDNAGGRRCMSIWPIQLDKTDNNKTKMRVKLPERTKSPTITSTGIMAAQLGADTNLQICDDIVPQSDVDQPTERKRRFDILSGTFGTRQRGQNTFRIVIGTFWHHDDALSNLWKLSDKSTDLYLNSLQVTGGPNTSPPFKPLWPEVFPASDLRRRFNEMNNNAALWAANYQGNPVAEEARLIKALKFYDPDTAEHADFLASSVFHISIDPTATNKETADKAGLIYVAVGEVPTMTRFGGEEMTLGYTKKARIIEFKEVHANQVELADRVANYSMSRPVYQVHVETRGGYHATADILQNKYGIESVRHDPGPKNKEQRLKSCAGIIDASSPSIEPLLEFPGVLLSNGKCGPADGLKDFYAQFLDFGFSKDDHCVDATTQLLNYLLRSGVLVPGGEASVITRIIGMSRNKRMDEELAQYDKPPVDSEADQSTDWKWFNERS